MPPRWPYPYESAKSHILDAAERAGFEISNTCDQNVAFRQDLATRHIAIVVLMTQSWDDIRAQPQTAHHAIDNATPGTVAVAHFLPRRGFGPPPLSQTLSTRTVGAKAQFRSVAEPWADTCTTTRRLVIAVLGAADL